MHLLNIVMGMPERLLRLVSGGKTVRDGQTLNGRSQMLIRLMDLRFPGFDSLPPVALRKALVKLGEDGPSSPELCDTEDSFLSLPDTRLPVRIYRPGGNRGNAPALLYLHGGGFVIGGVDSHDALCQQLAHYSGVTVVALAYRLAPEFPYPTAVNDAIGGYMALQDVAVSWGIDPGRIAVGGDSAGGNLTAVLCQQLKGEPCSPPFQLLIYPVTDLSAATPSYRLFGEGFFLTSADMNYFKEHYIRREQCLELTASPLLSADISGLPPACFVIAGFDPLRDEGMAYAERLEEAGVQVEMQFHPDQFHGFFSMGHVLPEGKEAIQRVAKVLRGALDVSPS
jgi:acetyl esterase